MNTKVYHRTVFKTAKLMEYEDTGQPAILIKFPFDRDTLYKVKSLPKRRYHDSFWSCPLTTENITTLKSWGFLIDDQLNLFFNKTSYSSNFDIPGLLGTPKKFQKECVSFIDAKNGRALIADEMGLGKTVEALSWLQLHSNLKPVIIVTPSSLKLNWLIETKNWLPYPKIQVLSGETPNRELRGNIIIINYDILQFWIKELLKIKAQVLITDECHYFKNNKAIRTKYVLKLGKQIPYFLALSGTPIENRPLEIYNAWKLIDPVNCPPFLSFGKRYCGGIQMDYKGATNIQELNNILTSSIMIRRLKKDVMPELPEKIRSIVPMDLDNWTEYKHAEGNFIEFVRKMKGEHAAIKASYAFAFAMIEELKQLTAKGKMKQVISWIEDYLDSGNKLIVFATHTFTIDTIIKAFPDISVQYDGRINEVNRQRNKDAFQNDPNIRLFVGMLDIQGRPAGVGITLTAAHATATVELQWSPGVHDQADDRPHRIGQKYCVNSYYLLVPGSIEDRIIKVLDKKRQIIDMTVDNKVTEQDSLLGELMKQYQNL